MNLIADIGNNSAKFFLFSGKQMILHTRITGNNYGIIGEWREQYGIERAIVSSVIDLAEEQKMHFTALDCPLLWFNSTADTPLDIAYRTPGTLGSDRLAAAVGAWDIQPGKNLLVIDAGSAITIDFVSRDGTYHGGNIAPGIEMRLAALHEHTNRLPHIGKEGEIPTLGYDTETAIRSGVINGIIYEIEGYIAELKKKHPELLVFLTGGDQKSLIYKIKSCIFADEFLVLKGLNRILTHHDNI